jgi:hypothetical protein
MFIDGRSCQHLYGRDQLTSVRLLLIVNTTASSVTARGHVVIQKALSADHDVSVAETNRRGHARRLAQGAANDGVDVVVCLGGDGTLNEVANGLAGSNTALAPLPGGSTNVFARTIGLPNDPVTAVDLLARGIDSRLLLLGAREPGREAYITELETLAARLGVGERIAISPPRADVRDVMAISTLVLQMSTSPESFGRTVVEALALCRPVLGYAHGGVDELLTELYPAGRVPLGDRARLAERAAELIRLAPAIQPLARYRLDDMQAATLALYADVAAAPRQRADD